MAVTSSVRVLAVTVALALAVVGCGKEAAKTLDADATQRAVGKVVASRVEPEVVETRCPGEIALEEGGTFDCTLTLAETLGPKAGTGSTGSTDPAGSEATLRVRVTQLDDEGRLGVVLRDAVLTVADVAADLKARLKATFKRSFQVSCGDVVHRVVPPKGTFTCRARDKGGPRTVTVTVADAAGTLRYDVVP